MACRVRVDPPAAGVGVQQARTKAQDLRVSLIEVRHVNVKVELLRVRAIWPSRRPEVLNALEQEYKAGGRVQGR